MDIQKKAKIVAERLEKLYLIEHKGGDPATIHFLADEILVRFIRDIGYPEITRAYKLIEKWYE